MRHFFKSFKILLLSRFSEKLFSSFVYFPHVKIFYHHFFPHLSTKVYNKSFLICVSFIALVQKPFHANNKSQAGVAISNNVQRKNYKNLQKMTGYRDFWILPSSCCQQLVGARPAPWSKCFYGDAARLKFGAPPAPGSTADNLNERLQTQHCK